jgi:hypothetical protein
LFQCVPDAASECEGMLRQMGLSIPVFRMVENVQYASPDFVRSVDEAMGGPALILKADSFGWVRRTRAYWCAAGEASAHDLTSIVMPADTEATRTTSGQWELRWKGKKPVPEVVSVADGFRPQFRPLQCRGVTGLLCSQCFRGASSIRQIGVTSRMWQRSSVFMPTEVAFPSFAMRRRRCCGKGGPGESPVPQRRRA